MERINPAAIPRAHLMFALNDRKSVQNARKFDSCLLCCRGNVNEAGLCQVCWALLSDEELKKGQRWLAGVGP
ncbi:MAG TPA: hypothetical protein VGL56_16610 [Fimbriimonadaceae bacterium]